MERDSTTELAGLARRHLTELQADLYSAGMDTGKRNIVAGLILAARLMPITEVKHWVERFVREEAATKAAEQEPGAGDAESG
jgi:hypothetical protein